MLDDDKKLLGTKHFITVSLKQNTYERFKNYGDYGDTADTIMNKIMDLPLHKKTLDKKDK
jgi:hypothetical protein